MSLTEYRRKRSFDKTREPEPGRTSPKSQRPGFVVQLHHASRRHYDFRLQIGDSLKSWAVPKGPSYDPAVKRMAVEVEDHPLDYADFEGEIPEGQYGAGHVARFDSGVWTTDGDPEEQLAKGHLRFELFGRKLKGGWHLVRSHKMARQPQWLLFKHQDEYAGKIEADDLLGDVAAAPAGDASRAGRGKPRKKNLVQAPRPKTSRKRWTAEAAKLAQAKKATLADEAFDLQLAKLGASPPTGDRWMHEIKWDGYRLGVTVVDGKARLWSRTALEWTSKLPEVAAALESLGLASAALDGELIAGGGTREDFNLLQATLAGEKQGKLTLVLFDLLHLDGIDISAAPLADRKALLEQVLGDPPAHIAYSSHGSDGRRSFEVATQNHFEGIISKRADRPYHGGRGDDWRKTKSLASDEFAVVGFTAPKGSRKGFGSLLLARPDPEHGWIYAGRVGSGFSAELIHRISKSLGSGVRQPTVYLPPHDTDLRSARWFEPSLVVEVFYRGIGGHGLLRQPTLKSLRPDKRADELRDSDRGRIGQPGEAPAKQAPGRAPASELPDFRLSSPNRVVYRDIGATKQDVAAYYAAVMDWLLPEIADRPLSVVRCTQGVGRPCFFQKYHAAGLGHVDQVKLKEEAGNQADYLVVRDARGLMDLVQFNALEFHPWGSTADDPDRADRIVFDLDPGAGVAWAEVVDAARQIRKLLKSLQLQSFVRTSGGKGLHVVVPVNPGCDWEVVRPFARGFADTLAAMEPLKYIATSTKKFRTKKIFVDYLRNGRGATSVASFSLRARDGAPVAMPLRWEELGKVPSGHAFDINSAVTRLKKLRSHPWAGIDEVAQDLDQVTRRLAERRR